MALSYVTYEKDGSHTYTITFKFLETSHVKLNVMSSASEGSVIDHTNFTISSDGATMTVGGTYYGPIKIYRQTPGTTELTKNEKVVDFQDGSVLTESDLDRSTLQALYASQESMDYVDDSIDASTGVGELPTTGSENYVLSSSTGSPAAPTWISAGDLKAILPASVTNDSGSIPIRSTDATPTIASSFVGPLEGDVTGNVSGTAGTLSPGKTIELTGDVEYTSPVFTGGDNIDAVATVVKLQGNAVSDNGPGDGEILKFRTGTAKWTPEKYNQVAVIVVNATDDEDGQAIANKEEDWVQLESLYYNTIGADISLDAATGIITLANGDYRLEWHQPFTGCEAGVTVLKQSTATTVDGDGLLSVSPTVVGKATVSDSGGTNHTTLSHGWGRVIASDATRYIQLQAYAQNAGFLGEARSGSDIPWDFFHTVIIVHKE